MPSWKKVITSGSAAAFSSLIVSSTITGSISGSLTGSLFGTASYVSGSVFTSTNLALSASYALTASYFAPQYTIYTATFTCSSNNNPGITVLENTLGTDLTWENVGPDDVIKIISYDNNQFFLNKKVYWTATAVGSNGEPRIANVQLAGVDRLGLYPYDLSGNKDFNIGDSNTNWYGTFEIKVFP